jgi:hypothetical protein
MAGGSSQLQIPLDQCRKIFVQRDYTNGLFVRFMEAYPPELHGNVCLLFLPLVSVLNLLCTNANLVFFVQVEEAVWHETITHLNSIYAQAEKVSARSTCETLLGCFTCYMSTLCVTSQYAQVGKFSSFVRSHVCFTAPASNQKLSWGAECNHLHSTRHIRHRSDWAWPACGMWLQAPPHIHIYSTQIEISFLRETGSYTNLMTTTAAGPAQSPILPANLIHR